MNLVAKNLPLLWNVITVFSFDPLRLVKILVKLEKNYSLDSCILEKFFAIRTPFGFMSVNETTALLILEITVFTLWFSLPVHPGSLQRIRSV